MVNMLSRELELRKAYLTGMIRTIYFGGGTPSLLPVNELNQLLLRIHEQFEVEANAEITLEGNPDDLTPEKLAELREAGVNRLSIGIQTFDDDLLRYLNRAHDREQSLRSIENVRMAGFDNVSADLIYAIPGEPVSRLKNDLDLLLALRPEHISTYCLTIEQGTVFGNRMNKGTLRPAADSKEASDYLMIMDRLADSGYDHYEISNFALPGYQSRHNTSYWLGTPYLGIGPGAHSYDGQNRQFNVSNNGRYMRSIAKGQVPGERDPLTPTDRINEYILVSLRTKWGVDLEVLRKTYGYNLPESSPDYFAKLLNNGFAERTGQSLILTRKGKLLADQIASDLFILEED